MQLNESLIFTTFDIVSLDNPICDDDSTRSDLTVDKNDLNPVEYNLSKVTQEYVETIIKGLSEREQKTLKLSFGIGCDKVTLNEIECN